MPSTRGDFAARARHALGVVGEAPGGLSRRLRVALGDIVVDLDAPPVVTEFVAERFSVEHPADTPGDIASHLHVRGVDVTGRRTGRRVWREGDSVWCADFPQVPGLTVRFRPGPPLAVETWLDQGPLLQVYKRLVAGVTLLHRLETLTTYALLNPALLAAGIKGRFPLHAAAVARDGQGLVLAGPPGAGKSTLTTALAARGMRILSDNIVLVGGDGLWPFAEPVKLDDRSRALAGAEGVDPGVGGGSALPATHARSTTLFDPVAGPVAPRALVYLERGTDGRLDDLGALDVEQLLELNRLAFELHAFYLYRAMARLAIEPLAGEHDTVGAALQGTRVLRLVVADGSVDEAAERLLALL